MQNSYISVFNTFLVSIFILIFSGCGGSTPTPAKKTIPTPAWVNSILPHDNDKQMFGMAIGKNREAAIQAALNNMVSRLGITIESSFQSKEKLENSYLQVSAENTIKADVSEIKINNYKVIKS